jgi:sugar-specific transcriptional regulator TrmB
MYVVLESLNSKGLATYIIKGKTKYFQAADPEKILSLFKEKEKKIENLLSELKLKQSQNRQSVELYEGIKSIKSLFLSILSDAKKSENWYGFGIGEYSSEQVKEFYNWLGPLKHNIGLKDHLLSSSENKQELEKGVEKESLKEFRKITKYSKLAFPGDVAIFRENVIILNWE